MKAAADQAPESLVEGTLQRLGQPGQVSLALPGTLAAVKQLVKSGHDSLQQVVQSGLSMQQLQELVEKANDGETYQPGPRRRMKLSATSSVRDKSRKGYVYIFGEFATCEKLPVMNGDLVVVRRLVEISWGLDWPLLPPAPTQSGASNSPLQASGQDSMTFLQQQCGNCTKHARTWYGNCTRNLWKLYRTCTTLGDFLQELWAATVRSLYEHFTKLIQKCVTKLTNEAPMISHLKAETSDPSRCLWKGAVI